MSEATTLPSEPPPLPKVSKVFQTEAVYSSFLFKFYLFSEAGVPTEAFYCHPWAFYSVILGSYQV